MTTAQIRKAGPAQPVVPLMPLPRSTTLKPPPRFHAASLSVEPNQIRETLEACTRLGLDLDLEPVAQRWTAARDMNARARAIWRDEQDRRTHSVDAAGRVVTLVRARVDELHAEADAAIVASAKLIRDKYSAQIVDALRERLQDVLAKQKRRKSQHPDPELNAFYEEIHALARFLRRTFGGDVEHVTSSDWWRFTSPERVWAYRLREAQRAQRARSKNVELRPRGDVVLPDGRHGRFLQPIGVQLSLATIAAHSDEWGATVVTGPELLETASRIEEEQGRVDPLPTEAPVDNDVDLSR